MTFLYRSLAAVLAMMLTVSAVCNSAIVLCTVSGPQDMRHLEVAGHETHCACDHATSTANDEALIDLYDLGENFLHDQEAHADDCVDQELLGEYTRPSPVRQLSPTATVALALLPSFSLMDLFIEDPDSALAYTLCPEPPPHAHQPLHDLATVRLLL